MSARVPEDIASERAVLGAILQPWDGEAVADDVRQVLPRWEQFADLRHQLIYRAVLCLMDEASPVDTVTVRSMLERLPAGKGGKAIDCLPDAGGVAYLMDLSREVESSANAPHYALRVADVAVKRETLRLAERLRNEALSTATSGAELLELAQAGADSLAEGRTAEGQIVSMREIVEPLVEHIRAKKPGEIDGILTGYAKLDYGGGLLPGDLIYLAGRPSMGKTAVSLNIAYQVASRGVPVGIFSLEMSEGAIATRTLSYLTGFAGAVIRSKGLATARLPDLYAAGSDAASLPIHMDFQPGATLGHVRRSARRMVSRMGCQLLILDYLQLMTLPKAESVNIGTSMVSKGLKALAKELRVPIIALSQLSRACEARQDKRPMLSDLRDSGSLEQDADGVWFVYRACVYDRDEPQDRAELLIRKRREGPTDELRLRFDRASGRFTDTEEHDGHDERNGHWTGHAGPSHEPDRAELF